MASRKKTLASRSKNGRNRKSQSSPRAASANLSAGELQRSPAHPFLSVVSLRNLKSKNTENTLCNFTPDNPDTVSAARLRLSCNSNAPIVIVAVGSIHLRKDDCFSSRSSRSLFVRSTIGEETSTKLPSGGRHSSGCAALARKP